MSSKKRASLLALILQTDKGAPILYENLEGKEQRDTDLDIDGLEDNIE